MGYGELKPNVLYFEDADGNYEKICNMTDVHFEPLDTVSVEIKNLKTGNSVAITVKG